MIQTPRRSRWLCALACVLGLATLPLTISAQTPKRWTVQHAPRQPHSGQVVTVVAQTVATAVERSVPQPVLEYQIVEPGNYIELGNPAYTRGWQRLTPTNVAVAAKEFLFQIPSEVQKHRRLVRYRLVESSTGQRCYPATNDSVPNAAWFVYDGIPPWKGAINPNGEGAERESVTVSAQAMRRVQAYHLLADKKSVENSTWLQPTAWGGPGRKEYRANGTLVSDDGTVYEGVRFRPRGGEWRHAMGKNMWKFDFADGHKLQARDDYGRPYRSKWSKLNLGACIQQGDSLLRGEQGMLESINFRLFNLAGVPAPRTHWVQLRIIDDAEETPDNQYEGDFWGLYLAIENVDGNFLKEHELPSQSLFKIEGFEPRFGHDAIDGVTEAATKAFLHSLFRPHPDAPWWRAQVNLPQYYSYRSILEIVHHYDIGNGKNYYLRREPATSQWTYVPWDTDLSWSDHVFGDGNEPFHSSGILRIPELRREYQNRLREIMDLLCNPNQLGSLIDECAAVISGPDDVPGITEADRRHWDHHPVTYKLPVKKARPGTFYASSDGKNFRSMVEGMKEYVTQRQQMVVAPLLANQPPPPKPVITAESPLSGSAGKVRFRITNETALGANPKVFWRIGAVTVTRAPEFDLRSPRRYEVETIWSAPGGMVAEIPATQLRTGTSYRVRARMVDASGNAGHWSEPVEFTFTE